MQIPPSLQSGLTGLQNAQSNLTQATVDVATPSPAPTPIQSSANLESDSLAPANSVDRTDALLSAIEAEQQGEAAVEVIEVSNETVGTIIDLEV